MGCEHVFRSDPRYLVEAGIVKDAFIAIASVRNGYQFLLTEVDPWLFGVVSDRELVAVAQNDAGLDFNDGNGPAEEKQLWELLGASGACLKFLAKASLLRKEQKGVTLEGT